MPSVSQPESASRRWPYAIVAGFVLFAGYIGYLVQQAVRSRVELVSPAYYQQELAYQQRMESTARTAALSAPVELHYHAARHQLLLALPAPLAGKPLQGQLRFFRPSSQQLDFAVPLQPDAQGRQQFQVERLQPGFWRLQLQFRVAGQAYFVEQPLTVQ